MSELTLDQLLADTAMRAHQYRQLADIPQFGHTGQPHSVLAGADTMAWPVSEARSDTAQGGGSEAGSLGGGRNGH